MQLLTGRGTGSCSLMIPTMKTMNLMDFNQVALLTCFFVVYRIHFYLPLIHVFMTNFVCCFLSKVISIQ